MRQALLLAGTAGGVIAGVIICALRKQRNPSEKIVLLAGEPNTGKTRLYQYMMNEQVVDTVKSAAVTLFEGCVPIRPNHKITLVDWCSDEHAIAKSYKETLLPNAWRAVFLIAAQNRTAAQRLAKFVVQTHERCQIFVNVAEPESQFLDDLRCALAAEQGVDESEIPKNLKFRAFYCQKEGFDVEALLDELMM